ncbi:MAG: hypothetical protein KAI47_24145, partial [Deltaproteobacteria bacterium]|nr:hypothetical protein [Deltaproteobacteria bacterium]
RLLVGLHNILFLSHPEVASWTVRHHRLQDLVAFTQWCLNVPVPLDEAELVARHTILANLTALTRTDVEVRFWVGHRRFLGQEPPRRLLRWPKVRRISRREEQVGWLASGTLSEDQDALLNALFHASPLTALLTVTRAAPGLRWEPLLPYLMRPRVCRVVAHAYLAEGLSRVGPPIARSFWEIVSGLEAWDVDGGPERRQRSQATLRFLADLVYYLYACECLVDAPTEGSFLPKGGEAIESLLSILVSAFHVNLLQSPSRLAEPAVAGRLNQLIATGREALSTDTTNALSASLQDALS